MCVCHYVNYLLLLSCLRQARILSTVFGKVLKYPMFLKFVQLEPSSLNRTDRNMDRHDEPNGHFSDICEAPNRAHFLTRLMHS
jgi:hypothetical protein